MQKKCSLALFISLLFIFFLACTDNSSHKESISVKYFSINNFIDNQIKYLKKMNPEISKTITYNSKIETQTLTDIDWEKELSVFKEYDINKPAWSNSYLIDTINNDTLSYDINYTTQDSSLSIKNLLVKFYNNKAVGFYANINSENFLYNIQKKVQYSISTGYSISENQNIKFYKDSEFKINAQFN